MSANDPKRTLSRLSRLLPKRTWAGQSTVGRAGTGLARADSAMLVDPAAASRENSSVTALLLALGLGFVSGLRTFTPVAAVMLVRGGIWGIVLAVAAVGEYVGDVLPNTPSRTQAMGLSARVVSGAFVGWMIATMHDGSGMFGAIAGIAGAVIGTYAGHAARLAAIARIGGYPMRPSVAIPIT